MRFENQVSIYDTDAIINKFNTQDTKFSVVNGKISAIISETEMSELISGGKTMYSQLADVSLDVDSLNANFHEIDADMDSVTSRVTACEVGINGLSLNVSTAMADISSIETWQSEVDLKITDSAIISTVVNSDGFSSAVMQEADSIRMQASKISWESDYSSMSETGELTCLRATIYGTVIGSEINGSSINGGYIYGSYISSGNFIIDDKIYTSLSHTQIDDGNFGLLICDDGMSLVGSYGEVRIETDGCITVFDSESSTLAEAEQYTFEYEITNGIRLFGYDGSYVTKITYGAITVGMSTDPSTLLGNAVLDANYEYLACSGSKDRIVTTDDYGVRALVCYEMPSPMFGDIGTGRTDEYGICYIDFNQIWSQTVDLDGEYYVFLQKEGDGDLYVAEKTALGFCVKGTPDLKFSWEVKAYQFDGRGKYLVDAGVRKMEREEL